MIRSKYVKAMVMGMCLSTLSTGIAFAQYKGDTPIGQGEMSIQIVEPSSDLDALYQKQSEIDQYLFTDHANDIAEKGFKVTYTGVVENYIEIGITPYSDANANYLYEVVGKDEIQIVDGDLAQTYTSTLVDPAATVASPDMGVEVSADILAKLDEINKIIYEDFGKEISDKGIMITHTSTTAEAIEIGISPYNQENIDFIYELTGKSLVSVVEGDPAIIYYTTMDSGAESPVSDTDAVVEDKVYKNQDDDFEIQIESTDATDGEVTTTATEDKEESTGPNTLLYAAGAGVLLAGGVVLARKKQSTQR